MAEGRLHKLRKLNKEANEGIRENLRNAKGDPRIVALVVLELILVTFLLMALLFLFDPGVSFPAAVSISWPVKLFLFLLTVIAVVWLYHYTSVFRKERKTLVH